MDPIVCTETSVRNSHHALCNNPEERSSRRWIILHGVFREYEVAWFNLAFDKNKWRTPVNTVMSFPFSIKGGESPT